MKPQELYSGPAPLALAQMGQGLAQAGANIGQMYQQGLSNLGTQIEDAASSVAKEYQTNKTSNSITKSLLSDPEMSKKLLGLDDKGRQDLLDKFNQTVADHGQVGGAVFSKQLLSPIQEYATIGRQYAQQQAIANTSAETSRLVGLGGVLSPYVFGAKGTQVNPQPFIDPSFGKPQTLSLPAGAQPQLQQSTQPSRMPPPTKEEVNAFMAENPNGDASDFSAWRQEQAVLRRSKLPQ